VRFCGGNIRILALLGTTREQYHQPIPVLAKVDPIARTKINPVLIDAGTHTFHVREVTLLHPMDGCRHLDRSGHIQAIEPFGIRAAPLRIEVLSNLCHMTHIVAYMLPFAIFLIKPIYSKGKWHLSALFNAYNPKQAATSS